MIPWLYYGACALGAIGVCMAMPRRGINPRLIGGLLAAIALGCIFLSLSLGARSFLPNYHYYIFSAIALGAAVRVITHPQPVYAALYFVLTILASTGLYVILGAEFMAFALVIVYAGAILITYLFVIMLATQAPIAGDEEAMAEYDRVSREPIAATVVGFVLVSVLTVLVTRGGNAVVPAMNGPASEGRLMALLPGKIERSLRDSGQLESDERIESMATDGTITVSIGTGGATRTIARRDWPEDLVIENVEGVGFELLQAKPGAIEIAGVILLMAMLGAVVLARKKVEMDDAAKAAAHLLVEPKPGHGVPAPHRALGAPGGAGGERLTTGGRA